MDWTALLGTIIERPCFDRPFVCDGFPDASNVIVIGENPSTDVKTDWWSFWGDRSGFDYDKFLADYKKRKSRLLGTRLRFDHLRKAGKRVIETNIFRDQSLHGSEKKIFNTSTIQLLINNLPDLKIVMFHGEKAKAHSHLVKIPQGVKVLKPGHFSRQRTAYILELLESAE